MSRYNPDLTIEDVLADPMILAMRRADRVDAAGFETLLRSQALVLAGAAAAVPAAAAAALGPGPSQRAASGTMLPPAYLCAKRLGGLARPGIIAAGSSRPW